MALPSGVIINDFTNGPLRDWGRSVTYEVPTSASDNDTGAKSYTYAAGTSITVVFHPRTKKYQMTKQGYMALGDAYVMAPTSIGILEGGRITDADGKQYIIQTVIRRPNASNPMFDFAECYLYDAQ